MIDGSLDEDDQPDALTEASYTTNIFTAGQVMFLFWALL